MLLFIYWLKGIMDVFIWQIVGNELDRVKGEFCVLCKMNCYIIF